MTRTARAMLSLCEILDKERRPLRLVEVGVQTGRTSRLCLQRFPHLEAILIDPWIEGPSCKNAEELYARCIRRSAFAENRRVVWRLKSLDAVHAVGDRSQSLILIDADHSYESVIADLRAWWPKLQRNGILAADDYTRRFKDDVKRAVDEWAEEVGVKGEVFQSKVWWCRRE